MIKLQVKEFTGVKLKIDKKKDGSLFIDFTPIIKHANKLIKSKLKELSKINKELKELHKILNKNQKAFANQSIFINDKTR